MFVCPDLYSLADHWSVTSPTIAIECHGYQASRFIWQIYFSTPFQTLPCPLKIEVAMPPSLRTSRRLPTDASTALGKDSLFILSFIVVFLAPLLLSTAMSSDHKRSRPSTPYLQSHPTFLISRSSDKTLFCPRRHVGPAELLTTRRARRAFVVVPVTCASASHCDAVDVFFSPFQNFDRCWLILYKKALPGLGKPIKSITYRCCNQSTCLWLSTRMNEAFLCFRSEVQSGRSVA